MAGLVPAIRGLAIEKEGMDARVKPGKTAVKRLGVNGPLWVFDDDLLA
jgi:hypothetical protein